MISDVHFGLVTLDLYPECQFDIEVSNEDNNG
jgi:hypothetical protein